MIDKKTLDAVLPVPSLEELRDAYALNLPEIPPMDGV